MQLGGAELRLCYEVRVKEVAPGVWHPTHVRVEAQPKGSTVSIDVATEIAMMLAHELECLRVKASERLIIPPMGVA